MVFLSYCHTQSDYADKIEAYLNDHHISILRDNREMKKNDSISDFMSRIRKSDYAILLISNDYLRSYYCLHEAFTAYQNRHLRNIIPVILPQTDCYSPGSGAVYTRYWYGRMLELKQTVDKLPPQLAVEQIRMLRQIENYCINFGEFLAYIQDNNSIFADAQDEWLAETCRCLYDRIFSREIRIGKVPASVFAPAPFYRQGVACGLLLAIDFGTSYTLASVLDSDGKHHLIPDLYGNPIHRSTVEFTDSGHYYVGSNGRSIIRNIKRLIGVKDTVTVNGELVSIPLLIAMILKSVILCAEEYTGQKIQDVLMAVPVDFSIYEKKILMESTYIAGVTISRFIPESSAEALLLPSNVETDQHVAFIDLGGGTLDISLAEIEFGVSDIHFTIGDRNFGSVDFDHVLEQLLEQQLSVRYGVTANDLMPLAEQVKRELGAAGSVTVSYPLFTKLGNIEYLPLHITTADLETAAADLLRRFDGMLSRLHAENPKPDTILLTGQGTKLHLLRQRIAKVFPGVRIVDTYQENAVISGLSVQNQIMAYTNQNALLLNTFPSSLHFRIGSASEEHTLLNAGWSIPTTRTMILDDFGERANGDTPVSLDVFERTVSQRKHHLFHTDFTPKAGMEYRLEVNIDANGYGTIDLTEQPRNKGDSHYNFYSIDYLYEYTF